MLTDGWFYIAGKGSAKLPKSKLVSERTEKEMLEDTSPTPRPHQTKCKECRTNEPGMRTLKLHLNLHHEGMTNGPNTAQTLPPPPPPTVPCTIPTRLPTPQPASQLSKHLTTGTTSS